MKKLGIFMTAFALLFMVAGCDNNGNNDNNGDENGNGNGPIIVAPVITTDSLPEGTVGEEYNETLEATGTMPITWVIETCNECNGCMTVGECDENRLPAGLTLDRDTGVISGEPTAEESVAFTVTARNAAGADTQELTIVINDPPPAAPQITTTSLRGGTVGVPYNAILTATGDGTITWAVTGGDLAPLSLNANTGVITGMPAAAGTLTFTVTATSSYGSDSRQLSIINTVFAAQTLFTWNSATDPVSPNPFLTGMPDTAGSAHLIAGSSPPVHFRARAANLPIINGGFEMGLGGYPETILVIGGGTSTTGINLAQHYTSGPPPHAVPPGTPGQNVHIPGEIDFSNEAVYRLTINYTNFIHGYPVSRVRVLLNNNSNGINNSRFESISNLAEFWGVPAIENGIPASNGVDTTGTVPGVLVVTFDVGHRFRDASDFARETLETGFLALHIGAWNSGPQRMTITGITLQQLSSGN